MPASVDIPSLAHRHRPTPAAPSRRPTGSGLSAAEAAASPQQLHHGGHEAQAPPSPGPQPAPLPWSLPSCSIRSPPPSNSTWSLPSSRCGHCKKLAPEYEKLIASFKKAKSVLIVKKGIYASSLV
ncbi:hypothetical protein E2562_036475 [Oryza meyeriana var. granulata]|uniref:Thioredoxin domain-containing protein n=1 Tax=Oryza meyeriana var. granulata TaxID=110450 RepID=A0A6G1DSH6_9ORYZ|nr:hypothetical protein E2562_036475 [Oryza meyeriana var. granulata]